MKASVLVPYYNRPQALRLMLRRYEELYSDLDYEILIYDDGSDADKRAEQCLSELGQAKHRLYAIPPKNQWRTPAFAFNQLGKEARSDLVCFQSPEVWHFDPVLRQAVDFLGRHENVYACAATFRLDVYQWQCREGNGTEALPYFAAMRKSDFERVGGFNEAFTTNMEDSDFVHRVERAGIRLAWLGLVYHLPIRPVDGMRSEAAFGKWGH